MRASGAVFGPEFAIVFSSNYTSTKLPIALTPLSADKYSFDSIFSTVILSFPFQLDRAFRKF